VMPTSPLVKLMHVPAATLEGVTEAELAVADSYLQHDATKPLNEAAAALPMRIAANNSAMQSDDRRALTAGAAAGAAVVETSGNSNTGENREVIARGNDDKNMDDDLMGMANSEGYHALLQLLRAKTPAELLRASSRLCSHVVSADDVGGGVRDGGPSMSRGGAAPPLPSSAGGARATAPTPGSNARLAEVLRRECNEILLSNGNEVDLAELLASPGRVIQVVSAKRQKLKNSCKIGADKAGGIRASSAAAWPCLSGTSATVDDKRGREGGEEGGSSCCNGGSIDVGGALQGVEDFKGGTDTTEEQEANDAIAQAPALQSQRSHLKRPEGLALHDLQVPIAIPPLSGVIAGARKGTDVGEEDDGDGDCDIDVPLADLSNALSPLLASSLGVAPESMRSFLRLDDLTFDLLSPLGSTRPEGKAATELDSFR